MRIYLAATLPLLKLWLAAGEAEVVTGSATAVTPTLREWYHDADLDELEHAASVDASIAALQRLAADPAAPRRRVVVAAEVADGAAAPAPSLGRAAVTLAAPVAVRGWASVLVDDAAAHDVIVAAVSALAAAAAGDDDAQFALDEAEARELGWYGVQEARYAFD